MRLLDPLFSTDAMRAVFSDAAMLQGMLDFEAALARAQSTLGVIPAAAAASIAAHCQAQKFSADECDQLARAAALAGNLAIPLVKMLTAKVAQHDANAARYVHWGATSQDAIDTGLVLQLRAGLQLLLHDAQRLSAAYAEKVRAHQKTPVAGRTWMQQALPSTLGLQMAGSLAAMERHITRLQQLQKNNLPLQLGGAVGTLASLGTQGVAVMQALGEQLQLSVPILPWHTQRDTMAEIATTLGLLTGSLGKSARDFSLAMQTEVCELLEPAAAGRGGSSTMPHKRNPVACAYVLAAATRVPHLVATMLCAMVQEQERGLGGWHAEWQTLPDIFCLSAGALRQLCETVEGLEIKTERMRTNLDATQGLLMAEAVTMALGAKIGRLQAHHVVEQACKQAVSTQQHLCKVLQNNIEVTTHLNAAELIALFEPTHYVGSAQTFIDRVLAQHQARVQAAA